MLKVALECGREPDRAAQKGPGDPKLARRVQELLAPLEVTLFLRSYVVALVVLL